MWSLDADQDDHLGDDHNLDELYNPPQHSHNVTLVACK